LNKCSILIPTYNEKENIPELTKQIWKSFSSIDFEIIFIDDNSPDGTAEVAEELADVYGNIKVLLRSSKRGLASAVLDGIKASVGNVIAVMDADLQHPPNILPVMFEKVKNGYDIVVASRYVEGGAVEGWSVWRRLVSRSAIKLAHLLLPKTRDIKDPMSGFFMFKKKVVDQVKLNPLGFKILLEILVRGKYSLVVEVPYTFKRRKKGESKLGFGEILKYILHVLTLLRKSCGAFNKYEDSNRSLC